MIAEHAKSDVRHSYTSGGVICIARQERRGGGGLEGEGAGKEGGKGKEGREERGGEKVGQRREGAKTKHSVSRL
jgi:hypothetical protein